MRRVLPFILLFTLLPASFFCFQKAVSHQKLLPKLTDVSYLPPAVILKITSLEYKGIVSDYWFLKVYTFYGESLHRTEKPRIKKDEWRWMINVLDTVTELDPYFLDPYYFANAFITWEAGLVAESNVLLSKGSRYRNWDPLLPFYAGFNYYYFLNDADNGFYYLKEASQRSGGNPFYDSLASRVAYKANKTEFAISYLENQIQQAELQGNSGKTLDLERRLNALKGIRQIEVAVESYRKLFGTLPTTVSELSFRGLMSSIPSDPYGGTFYIAKDGSIKTTSDMTFAKKRK